MTPPTRVLLRSKRILCAAHDVGVERPLSLTPRQKVEAARAEVAQLCAERVRLRDRVAYLEALLEVE